MTIKEIYDLWLPEKKRQCKPSTIALYYNQIHTHILPYFGEKEYDAITMRDIQDFIYKKEDDGLSRKTIVDISITLKMLLSYAQEEFGFPGVPGRKKLIYPNKKEQHEIEAYTEQEQKKIISYLSENLSWQGIGIMLTLCTGMRIGEITALRYEDIDFDKKTLCVNKTLERVYDLESTSSKKTILTLSSPKTEHSLREIPIPKEILSLIRKNMGFVRPDFYVCSGASKPIEPRVYRNYFYRVCDLAGVRRLKFHGLRHSFATRMLEKKVDIKTTSVILGHSNVGITMNTYMHPNNEAKARAVSLASNLFAK